MPEQNVFGHLVPNQSAPTPANVPSGSPVGKGPVYGAPKPEDPYKPAQEGRAAQGQANENLRTSLAVQDQQRQNAQFPMSRGDALRQDFEGLQAVKNLKTTIPILMGGLKASPDAAGDLQLINAYAKIVDPTSVVREGEMTMTANTDSLVNSTIAKLKKQFGIENGGELSPKAREGLRREMNKRANAYMKAYGVERLRFQQLAQRQGVNPEDVVGGYPVSQGQISEFLKAFPSADQNRPPPVVPGAQHGPAPDATQPGPPPGYEAKFNDEIPPPTAYRMSPENEKAYLAFIESQKGNPGFTLDMANRFLQHLGEQPVEDNGFVKATQEGNVRTSGVDTSRADAAYKAQVDALAKQRDTYGGEADAFGRGAADMATLGLADKIAAGINTVTSGGTYADNLAKERLTSAADAQSNPWARLGGQITGAAILPMGEARGVVPLVTKGAGYGAAYSGLSSDKPVLDRGSDVISGGIAGAMGGAAGKGVEVAGKAAAPFISKGVNALLGPSARGVQEVSQNMNALLAGERQGINMRQPDIRPSTRADFAAAEASQGGNPIITNALESDKAAVANRVAQVGGAGAPQDAFSVGERVQKAGTDYIAKSREQANALYSRAEKLAGPAKATPEEAASTLAENIAELKANGSKSNAGAIKYLEDLQADLGSGPISIDKLRSLRTNMRGQINERNLTSTDTERRVITVLDAAARDIEKALANNPKALAAYQGADKFFREKQDFIKQVVQTFTGTRNAPLSPEQAASRLTAMTKQGGDSKKFARMWSQLEPAEKSDIQATIAESFGVGRNGEFSLAALATNLRKTNPRTIREVFGADGAKALNDLREIAEAKTATANALNKSRTGVVTQRNNAFKDLLVTVLGGGVGSAGGIPGAVAGAAVGAVARRGIEGFASRRAAKLLLNPDFTKWLKTLPNTSDPRVINRSFEQLDKIVARSPSIRGDAKALQEFLGQAFSQSPTKAAAAENENSGGPPVPQN